MVVDRQENNDGRKGQGSWVVPTLTESRSQSEREVDSGVSRRR